MGKKKVASGGKALDYQKLEKSQLHSTDGKWHSATIIHYLGGLYTFVDSDAFDKDGCAMLLLLLL